MTKFSRLGVVAPLLLLMSISIYAAEELTTIGTILVNLRGQALAAGPNAVDFSARLAQVIYLEARSLGNTATDFLVNTTTTLGSFLRDTAHGISNAVLDFLQDVPGTLFDLGRTLNFSNLNPFTNAYAAALTSQALAPELRRALEDAREIVQHAGQTVVVQQGIGPNPFETPGFNPESAPLATGTVKEEGVKTFTAYLPYEAGAGGQAVQLTLNGLGANAVTVLSGGQELTPGTIASTALSGMTSLPAALDAIS